MPISREQSTDMKWTWFAFCLIRAPEASQTVLKVDELTSNDGQCCIGREISQLWQPARHLESQDIALLEAVTQAERVDYPMYVWLCFRS